MTGVLPVDKPAGPTSHDVVAMARRALGIRRIGHTGTLDPFATGLLLLCIDRATRLSEYLTGLDKVYEATARLGVATDTLDGTGTVTAETEAWQELAEPEIRAAWLEQTGRRIQAPPSYSAKKVDGRRAYERARAGEAVAPDPVEVVIHSMEVLAVDGPDVRFRMRCSSGTYVRAVARDAGDTLGVGAHLTSLRRTGIGGFTMGMALPVDRLDDRGAVAAALISPLEALAHLPKIDLDDDEVEKVGHGQALSAGDRAIGSDVVVLAAGGRLVAVAERDGASLRPRKVFT